MTVAYIFHCYTQGLWPAEYRVQETPSRRRQSPLDPNHSHFILVDNGTQNVFGTEISFRAKLESKIAREKTSGTDGEIKVAAWAHGDPVSDVHCIDACSLRC